MHRAVQAVHGGARAAPAGLFVGGIDHKKQARQLEEGVDVVVGTPRCVADWIRQGKLDVSAVRFFVLDEADRLLDTGNADDIRKLFNRLPKRGTGTHRLQTLMFSATLHSPDVRKLAGELTENPTWVDLKGKDAVPEAVDHVVVSVDPKEDRSWLQSEPAVPTDGCHAWDDVGVGSASRECWSEAVKRLKPRMLLRLVDALKIEQAIVFCRTNHDCDNLEKFLMAAARQVLRAARERPESRQLRGARRRARHVGGGATSKASRAAPSACSSPPTWPRAASTSAGCRLSST